MINWSDYLSVHTEGDNLKRKPYAAEQKKWADWNKGILKKWGNTWCRIYEDNGEWDWYFEATQDHFGSFWGRYEYDFRYPSETNRDNKEIWVRRLW